MAGKKDTNNHQLIVGASMADSFTSSAVMIRWQDNVGLQLKWSGTPTGVFTVECSNNRYPETNQAGDFYSLTFSPSLDQPAGAAGGYLINLNQVPFSWVRVVYTRSSGTGTLDCWLTSKEV